MNYSSRTRELSSRLIQDAVPQAVVSIVPRNGYMLTIFAGVLRELRQERIGNFNYSPRPLCKCNLGTIFDAKRLRKTAARTSPVRPLAAAHLNTSIAPRGRGVFYWAFPAALLLGQRPHVRLATAVRRVYSMRPDNDVATSIM